MSKTNTPLLVGGAALGLYLLLGRNSSSTSPLTALTKTLLPGGTSGNGASPVVPNAPALTPLAWNEAYYNSYQYPQLVANNPNLQNPNYQLTDADASNYLNNYLELQQWVQNADVKKKFGNNKAALQWHWTTYGVPYHYSFVPFTPPKNVQWTPPPVNKNSSGNSSMFTTILGDVATVAVAALAGDEPLLNDAEINLVLTSAAVTKKILPFYLFGNQKLVSSISQKLDSIISAYE